jgi:hypothetical protein
MDEAIRYVMKATGKTRRQATHALLEKLKSGEIKAFSPPPPVEAIPTFKPKDFERLKRNWRPAPDFVVTEDGVSLTMSHCEINALSPDHPMLWVALHEDTEWCWGMKLGDQYRIGQRGGLSAESAKDGCWRVMAETLRAKMT